MPIRVSFKRIFRRSRDDGASERSLIAQPDPPQQADASVNDTFSSRAPNAASGASRPLSATDRANAPQERPQDEPTEQPLIPKDSGGSIRQMWDVAYEDLQDKEKSLVQAFEEQVCGNLSAGLGSLTRSHVARKDWLETVLKHKMKQVSRDAWKLEFGSTEILVQDVVKPVLTVVKWANGFIAEGLSSNPYASIAWSGVSLLLPLFLTPFEQASALAKGLEHISSLIVRSSIWEDLYVRHYESDTSGVLSGPHTAYRFAMKELYREILKFQIVSYHHFCHRTISRLGLDAVKHNDWNELLEQIKYRETEFEKVLTLWRDKMSTDEWNAAQARHKQVMSQWQSIGTDVSDLKEEIENMRKDESRNELLEWLCTVDPSVQYNAAREKHRDGTCEWLVKENKEFKTWEEDSQSFLWLCGKAGSGKSVLSSSVIQHLQDKHEEDPKTALAYFFFSFGNLEQQKVTNMLSSLIRQLCASRPDTPPAIERFKDQKAKGQRPGIKQLEDALIDTIQGFSAVYIVIDALDECPAIQDERSSLLDSLRRILGRMPDTLHIFCTSRDEQDIRSEIDKVLLPAKTVIDLTNNRVDVDKDLSLYIDKCLDAQEWPDDIKATAKSALMERADGMQVKFQYLVCQFEVLKLKHSKQGILETLDLLPRGLDETYNRLLLKLAGDQQVLDSLKWLAFSNRPLHIKEFAEASVLRPEAVNDLEKQRPFQSKHALLAFPSIVTTEKRLEKTWNREGRRKWRYEIYVRLTHFTVKEYLTSDRIKESNAMQFSLTEVGAHLHIARCCLSYHLGGNAEDKKRDDDLPLKEYAARNWTWHLELVPRASWTDEVVRLAEQALYIRSESLRTMIMERRDARHWFFFHARDQNMHRRPYCYTAATGCLNLTKLLLRESSFRASTYLTKEDLDLALREAVQGGSLDILKFLLHEGADVNGKSQVLNGALQIAAYRDNLEIMELLLDHGAKIDEHDGRRGSALKAAALDGNLEALRFLVNRKADVGKAGCVLSCLIAAYKKGDSVAEYTEVLHLLLRNGATINRKCTEHGSPLNQAVKTWLCQGTRSFFDIAIQRGADMTLDDGRHGSALQAACLKHDDSSALRCPEVLETLLDMRAADSIDQGGEYDDALQTACYENSHPERLVHLLLDRGADINKRGGRYGSALHAACVRKGLALVDFLLERGADVRIQGGEYGSVLQAACSMRYLDHNERLARTLIEKGADVNAHGGKFGSALQAAALLKGRYGADDPEGLERLLLSKGAEVNRKGGIYGTALQSACVGGRLGAVRLLLSHGAEVNAEGGKYGTALQAACVTLPGRGGKCCDVARELIEHGADVHVRGGLFGSAWHAAAATGYNNDLLHLLLDCGADVNDCRGQHGTALQASLELNDDDSVIQRIRFLLDRGADVNLGAGRYGFPLQSACLAALNNPNALDVDLCANTHGLVYLLENCPEIDVNMTGGLFGTALQAAVYKGKPKAIIELLLEKGACVKVRGGKYRSALNAAVLQGYWDLVETLLNAGAEPDCQLSINPDEEWLKEVEKEDGQGAVDRYRKFWEVEKLKLGARRVGDGQDDQRT